jgi:hypothetical protein
MVSTKDLRDILDEATKRAGDAIGDAKIPNIVQRDTTPGMLYFGIGLALGALVGLIVAMLATPVSGQEARHRLNEQVERMRRRDEIGTNGATYPSPAGGQYASPTTGTYERT